METLPIVEYEGYLQYTSHTAMIQLHSLNSEIHSHKLNLLKNSNASCKMVQPSLAALHKLNRVKKLEMAVMVDLWQ